MGTGASPGQIPAQPLASCVEANALSVLCLRVPMCERVPMVLTLSPVRSVHLLHALGIH